MNHRFELGDCFEKLKTIEDNSVDLCLTDPPYFLDALGDEWDTATIKKRTPKTGAIRSLPKGMKFNPQQGIRFQEFEERLSKEIFRVLKPGGFYLSFSSPRLYHRMTIGIENCGFEIRDMIGWTYQGQAKAFSQDHIIKKQKNLTNEQKETLINELAGWKTPQLKPCIEPICLAQKPAAGLYIENWQKWGVGLMNTNEKFDGTFPGNIIPVAKPTKKEKGLFNDHVSVKPVKLFDHLIKLFTRPGGIVLDPFLGSGTTLISSDRTGRNCIGFEISPKYYEIIKKRYLLETHQDLHNDSIFTFE